MLSMRVLLLFIILILSSTCGCDKKTQTPSKQSERWEQKIRDLREKYETNKRSLLSDWKDIIQQTRTDDLNAAALNEKIGSLIKEIKDDQKLLSKWSDDLRKELNERGINPDVK